MAVPVTFVAGDVLEAAQLNDNFSYLDAGTEVASFAEYQASGTQGGASVTGSFIKRTLNTTITNTITGCTLTSSVIALPAGTYAVTASVAFFATRNTQIILRNTTDSTTTIFGTNIFNQVAGQGAASATLTGTFTIAATKNFEVQYRCAEATAVNGLGTSMAFGSTECYALITIIRIL
jgi:hypothetical protein